jgi:hypothetical protein
MRIAHSCINPRNAPKGSKRIKAADYNTVTKESLNFHNLLLGWPPYESPNSFEEQSHHRDRDGAGARSCRGRNCDRRDNPSGNRGPTWRGSPTTWRTRRSGFPGYPRGGPLNGIGGCLLDVGGPFSL